MISLCIGPDATALIFNISALFHLIFLATLCHSAIGASVYIWENQNER